MSEDIKYLGYIKYEGKLVEEGLLDIKKSAEALLGFDEMLRYFLIKERSDLRDIEFDIPVQIKKGSWFAGIPENIGEWLLAGGGIVATTYLASAAKKMAENDFDEVSLKNIFRGAIKSVQWMIKITKHAGGLENKKFNNIKWGNNNESIGIPNDSGEYLYVPIEQLELFSELPRKLFEKNSIVIEEERSFSVGLVENGKTEEVSITIQEKNLFYKEDDDGEDVLFPELKHGQHVELEGYITRGNKNSNTLGLEYKKRILTCIPAEGSVTRFKDNLFSQAKVFGAIDRNNELGHATEKKPKIIFSKINNMEPRDKSQSLFL